MNKLIVKYATLLGLAYMINLMFSAIYGLEGYTLDFYTRLLIFSIVLYLGSIWGAMGYEKTDKY